MLISTPLDIIAVPGIEAMATRLVVAEHRYSFLQAVSLGSNKYTSRYYSAAGNRSHNHQVSSRRKQLHKINARVFVYVKSTSEYNFVVEGVARW